LFALIFGKLNAKILKITCYQSYHQFVLWPHYSFLFYYFILYSKLLQFEYSSSVEMFRSLRNSRISGAGHRR